MKTEHEQLRDMMDSLGYGPGKYYQKLSDIFGSATTVSTEVRLRPSKKFPSSLKLALWIYGEIRSSNEVLRAKLLIAESELNELSKIT